MKELSDEAPNPQELAEAREQVRAPAPAEDARETGAEVFAFDGWGLVPLDLHAG